MGSISERQGPQVVVAGGGPVGLFAALTLARKGVSVVVLDKADGVDTSPRGMAFQPCAIAEMIESGIYEDDVKKQCISDAVISWWRARTDESIGTDADPKHLATISTRDILEKNPENALAGLNIGQDVLSHILLKHLATYPHAAVHWGHEVVGIKQQNTDNGGVEVTYKVVDGSSSSSSTTQTISTQWVIAADGGRSTVRKLLDVPFEGFSWTREQFVASNVYDPFEKYGFTTRNFVIDGVNWAIIAKIRDDDLWRIAFGADPDQSDEEIKAHLQDHYRYLFPGPATGWKLERLNKYRPHQRCVTSMKVGRVMFAGDAAHLNNPIGGLGLTTGILDVGPLGRALAAVIQKGAPTALLDKWARARRDTWWQATNRQSIEFKRIAQQGGYGNDPRGVWDKGQISEEQKDMLEHFHNATPEAKAKDEALYQALKDPKKQAAARAGVWKLALPADWMAEFEDEDVVRWRQSFRPVVDN